MAQEFNGIIQQAPATFTAERFGKEGIHGKVMVSFDTMTIFSTLMGDIAILHPKNISLKSGSSATLKPTPGPEREVSVKVENKRQKFSYLPDIEQTAFRTPSGYRINKRTKPNTVLGHAEASSAALNAVIKNSRQEDAFGVARSLTLLPDLSPQRGTLSKLAFLFMCFSKGTHSEWSGSTEEYSEFWSTVLRGNTIAIPGMGDWKTHQFPILTDGSPIWGFFATPSNEGKISRFIIELPTSKWGMTQLKAYGADDQFEIVINTENEIEESARQRLSDSILATSSDQTDLKIEIITDKDAMIDFTQARRIQMEA